jgi:hypothetical protein
MRDAVLLPLGHDPGRQAHRPIASFTKQAEDGDIDPQGRWRELAFRRHGDAMRQLTGPDSDG